MKKIILSVAAAFLCFSGFAQLTTEAATTPWELEVKARMDLMRDIQWTPLGDVPMTDLEKDCFFPAGETQKGCPYSGVSRNDGFIGINISFYTFLSSVNNPYSKLYTVNFHKNRLPKMGVNAGPYYGSVCTGAAFYVWGYPTVYLTKLVCMNAVPFLEDLGTDIDRAKLLDAVCYHDGANGHIIIFESITRDSDGRIVELDAFEETIPLAVTTHYTREDFLDFVKSEGKGTEHYFRFHHEQCPWMKQPAFVEQSTGFEYTFPEDICLEEGDRKTFSEGKDVAVNILCQKGAYRKLILKKDGKRFRKMSAPKDSIVVFSDLPCGDYVAMLAKGIFCLRRSAPTSFQVASEDFKLRWEEDKLIVYDVPEGVTPIFGYPDPWENTRPMSLAVPSEKEGEWILIDIPENARTTSVTLSGKYSAFNSSQKPVPAR